MHGTAPTHPRLCRTSQMLSTSFEYVAKYTKVRARACGGVGGVRGADGPGRRSADGRPSA